MTLARNQTGGMNAPQKARRSHSRDRAPVHSADCDHEPMVDVRCVWVAGNNTSAKAAPDSTVYMAMPKVRGLAHESSSTQYVHGWQDSAQSLHNLLSLACTQGKGLQGRGMENIDNRPMSIEEFDQFERRIMEGEDWAECEQDLQRIRRSILIHNAIVAEIQRVTELVHGIPNAPKPMGMIVARPQSVHDPLKTEAVGRCVHGVWMDTTCHQCRREMPPRDATKLPHVDSNPLSPRDEFGYCRICFTSNQEHDAILHEEAGL